MGFRHRQRRWHSDVDVLIRIAGGAPLLVRLRDVSRSGMKCLTDAPAQDGDSVALEVLGREVLGMVVRQSPGGFAAAFHTLLSDWELESVRSGQGSPEVPGDDRQPGLFARVLRRAS